LTGGNRLRGGWSFGIFRSHFAVNPSLT